MSLDGSKPRHRIGCLDTLTPRRPFAWLVTRRGFDKLRRLGDLLEITETGLTENTRVVHTVKLPVADGLGGYIRITLYLTVTRRAISKLRAHTY